MELTPLLSAALPLALFLIMLGMGMTLERADFERVGRRGKAFAIGFTSQMLLPPLLALGLVFAFSLPPELAVGLMVLSFCPSGTTSNLFSYLAGADVALSISLTAIAALVTPFSLPLLTELVLYWQYGDRQSVPFPVLDTVARLAVIVLLPVAAGMLWRARAAASCRRWQPRLHRFSVLLFAAVIVGIVVDQGDRLVELLATAGTVCLLLVLAAMLLGWQIGRLGGLPQRQVKTISIEVGMQHAGMALVVTQGVLHNPDMSIIPLTYGLLMLIPATALAAFTRRRSAAGGETAA
ncbi:MAG: bile acid:sodium symporter family protein [Gammaproteobacteria bacterium]|nr:bile acid:sodium symporter family protein [Gammaproteobacteria bacterium]